MQNESHFLMEPLQWNSQIYVTKLVTEASIVSCRAESHDGIILARTNLCKPNPKFNTKSQYNISYLKK